MFTDCEKKELGNAEYWKGYEDGMDAYSEQSGGSVMLGMSIIFAAMFAFGFFCGFFLLRVVS